MIVSILFDFILSIYIVICDSETLKKNNGNSKYSATLRNLHFPY